VRWWHLDVGFFQTNDSFSLLPTGKVSDVSICTCLQHGGGSTEAPRISIEPLQRGGGADGGSSAAAVAATAAALAASGANKLPDFLLHKLDAYSHTPPHELKVSAAFLFFVFVFGCLRKLTP